MVSKKGDISSQVLEFLGFLVVLVVARVQKPLETKMPNY